MILLYPDFQSEADPRCRAVLMQDKRLNDVSFAPAITAIEAWTTFRSTIRTWSYTRALFLSALGYEGLVAF